MHSNQRRTAKGPTTNTHDVIIIGGGLAGGTLAALLGTHGIHVACIDRDNPKATLDAGFDGRTTAISWGSQKIMRAAGVWDALEPHGCAIRDIEILDGDSPTLLHFAAQEVGGESFGWIIENRLIRSALFDRMADLETVDHIAPAGAVSFTRDDDSISITLEDGRVLTAALVIGADGRGSKTREWMGIEQRFWAYDQTAIVCTARHDHPHDHIAVEHFRSEGPFAILPMQDDADGTHRSSIVWTVHGKDVNDILAYSQDVFDAALTARFPDRYGSVQQMGKRFSFPLTLNHAHDYIADRMALVADAGHGIHPIAGQGLNLGLRDIAVLADLIVDAHAAGDDIGHAGLLQSYQRQRRADNMAMAGTTDTLNKLFSNRSRTLSLARKIGLRAVSRIKPVKNFFMHQAMGAAGLLPDLIRDAQRKI